MNTIALAVPVVVGLEVAAALGLAWLCWRLAERRNLLALRDIARAFLALGAAALIQLSDGAGNEVTLVAAREFFRSLSVWLYLGFMILGAAQLASNNFVTDRVRRDAVVGAGLAALLSSGISLIAIADPVMQDMIANALRAGGTVVACLIIARVVSQAPEPPKMVLGASVVRVALTLVTILAAVRASVAMLHSFSQFSRAVPWQPLLTVEFLAHCALGVGLLVWILDRDWALAHASMQSAEHRAGSDPLTGLPNRTIVMDRLEMAVALARRNATLVGVLYMDLDEFKAVNDRHGHLAGDAVLRAVSARLQHLLRASDTVGRIGGDEFVAISPDLRTSADLDVVVQKLREALKTDVLHDGISISVDGSVGAALFPRDADAALSLLAASDSSMYRDKALRRPAVLPTAAPPQIRTA
jgi:diguanylate cyclase (GGDEF)-like protein